MTTLQHDVLALAIVAIGALLAIRWAHRQDRD